MCKHMIRGCVTGSTKVGEWQFATRRDYEEYFLKAGSINERRELWQNEALTKAVQQHWLSKGQTGCYFARTLAGNQQQYGWETVVFSHSSEELNTPHCRTLIDTTISEAIRNSDCQVVSLLFPHIVEPADLLTLLRSLAKTSHLTLQMQSQDEVNTTVGIRVPVGNITSWVLGFGPFAFMPTTRRAPVADLTLRVKPKPEHGFEKLTPDSKTTHLADVPLEIGHSAYQKLWESTVDRTAEIRGDEPRHYSKARVTFAVPTCLWLNSGLSY